MTRVLFSPVGTADPMTMLGDGPMLHIVRHYMPEYVVLYLSDEMYAHQNDDMRYTKAIEQYCKINSQNTKIELIKTSVEVHRYDSVLEDIRHQLFQVSEQYRSSEIIVNVSSGTPQITSGLLTLASFGIPPLTAVQVDTPNRAANQPGDREPSNKYDFDTLWELNPDNAKGASNRCIEVATRPLGVLQLRESLKELIRAYNYTAAVRLNKNNVARLSVNAANLLIETDEQIRFVRSDGYTDNKRVSEAVSALQVLVNQERWGDFLRYFTAPYTEWLRSLTQKHLKIPFNDVDSIDINLLDNDSDAKLAFEQAGINIDYKTANSTKFLHPKDYLKLLEVVAPEELHDFPKRKFKRFEYQRNRAAHQIKPFTQKGIAREAEIKPQEVMDTLAKFTGADLKLYENLNKRLIALIDDSDLRF